MNTLTLLLVTLIASLVLGMPIFMSLAIATFGSLMVSGFPLSMIPQTLYSGVDNFPLLAIPCFIVAGSLMEHGGITRHIINVVKRPAANLYGGLGIATILACMFFSAISGSGPGTVAAVGSLLIPAMIKQGYSKEYAGAVSSSGGSLGILIPPSNPMIIYAVIANVSVTGMFMAGMIPGLIIGVSQCLVAWYIARKKGFKGEAGTFEWKVFGKECWDAKWSLATPLVILGGIYSGIFTPVEASVVAVFWGLLVGGLIYRELSGPKIMTALVDGVMIGGTVLVIVGTSTMFGQLLTLEQVPVKLASLITSISENKFVVMLLLVGVFYVLGMFMETLSTIIILTPILLPVVVSLGIDPIHFGVIFVVTNEIAFLTPPLGVNLFVASKLSGVSLERLSINVFPYIIAITLCVLLLLFVPALSTWLPRFLGYGLI
ncbi:MULTISPECIES: TRAP transporter large permease [Desulfosediminicola]|uniref:TRAP transporter large permease n=1 Tax=Desulfosediminicola TaxID=2886823 RepID=UPI0010ABED67|nr:TRAP transporter large permease [Desulfosediminicola ganghwensis]